jgi:uncharacterized RDD family membrane protein YckC
VERVRFRYRLAAAGIDLGVLFALGYGISNVTQWLIIKQMTRPFVPMNPSKWFIVVITLTPPLVLLGYMGLELLARATPGKMLLKLRVRREDGGPATAGALVGRWLIKCSGILVEFAWALFFCIVVLARGSVPMTLGYYAGAVVSLMMVLNLMVLVFWLFALGKRRQAVYDRVTRTGVFRLADVSEQARAFEPVLG